MRSKVKHWLLNIAVVSMGAYACVSWYGRLTAPKPEYFVREDGSRCILPPLEPETEEDSTSQEGLDKL